MIFAYDKFLISVIGAVLFALNEFAGIDLGIGDAALTGLVAVLTPVLVYFVPNKEK